MAENLDQVVDNQDQQDTGNVQDNVQNDTKNVDNSTIGDGLQIKQKDTGDWRASLNEDFKNDPAAEKFKDVNGLFKSYKDLEKLVGREKLPVPPENATKEDWELVYSRLGRPDNPEGYEIADEIKNKVPPELHDEQEEKAFKQKAYELGLNKEQYKNLMDWYYTEQGEKLGKMQQTQEKSKKEAETQLRKDWGKAFDSKLEKARQVLNNSESGEELAQVLKEKGLNNNPAMIKFLAEQGDKMSEDTISGKGKGTLMTPQAAQQKIASIMSDKNHPYFNKGNPEHKFVVQEMESLHEMAYPSNE